MAIQACRKCGAKNRVDERVTFVGKQPVCGRCGAPLSAEAGGDFGRAAGAGAPPPTDAARPRDVTDATFASEVVGRSSRLPVLLDCWAPWCGPCRMVAPVLEQLAAESEGRYLVAKLNVDENPRTAAQFGIRSIPTLLIFKNGEAVERIVGAQPRHVLAARLAAHA